MEKYVLMGLLRVKRNTPIKLLLFGELAFVSSKTIKFFSFN